MRIVTYGFDPGLRHGALLAVTFDFGPEKKTHWASRIDQIESWTKKDDHLGKSTEIYEATSFIDGQVLSRLKVPCQALGFEWDPTSVYWQVQKSQVVQTAFILGYLVRGLQALGIPQVVVTPAQLKKAFGISPREKKKEYMVRPICLVGYPPLMGMHDIRPQLKTDDLFDAFLLAYFTAVVIAKQSGG